MASRPPYLIHFKHRYLGFRHLDLQSAALAAGVREGDWGPAADTQAAPAHDPAAADPGEAAAEDADLWPLPPGPAAPVRLAQADPADPLATPFWRAGFPSDAAAAETAGRATLVKASGKREEGREEQREGWRVVFGWGHARSRPAIPPHPTPSTPVHPRSVGRGRGLGGPGR
jgi:hypothetical protein